MIWIKDGMVIDPVGDVVYRADLVIENGRISRILKDGEALGEESSGDVQVIDGTGLMVAPGLADTHVHFRDPGFTYKEDIDSGAAAAVRGGFTQIVLMANTKPPVDNVETLCYVLDKGRGTGIHIASCVNVTRQMEGKELVDMETLAKAGAAGFTDDGIPLVDEELVRKAMIEARKWDKPISFHEEDPALIVNNGVNAGKVAAHYGIGGSPREAEIGLVKRDLELARQTGAEVVIQHISTKEGVALVRQAKQRAAEKGRNNIHAEATPHHFSLTEEAVLAYGTLAKMNPPLREEADRQAVIEGLRDGTIDLIATDHAPHSEEEKKRRITEAPSGIIGLETALPLGITNLFDAQQFPMDMLIDRMSTAPARMYNLPAGTLSEGAAADIVIFDAKAVQTVGGFASKSSNSPFTGQKLNGVVKYTIVDGAVVYQAES